MGPLLVALLVSLAPAAAADGGDAPSPASPAAAPAAHPDPAYLDELLARARTLRLWQDPAWLRLGHYRRTQKGGFESEADGMAFFRALRGKTDPRAELEATLRGFFDDRPVSDPLADAQCHFPARFTFLAARLGFDASRLARRSCPGLDAFTERVRAKSVTLVFSSYYLNNPVSSFGHTFLRLNKDEVSRDGKRFELLDYGFNFAATVDGSTGFVYALKGLLGYFRGEYSHLAYYYKVREYADAESRDLWEYDLALTPDEVALVVAHLWELGGTYFDYYYLDENCSYHILDVLEATVPRAEFLAHVGRSVVLPSETVKAVFRNPGLVKAVRYRPSIRAQFEARAAGLSSAQLRFVEALTGDPAGPTAPGLSPIEQAAALDAAVDLLDLRYFRDLTVGKAPEAAQARQALLVRRSAVAVASPELVVPTPESRGPHLGHGETRLALGGGWSTGSGALLLLDIRLALHDLGDPAPGYPALSQIEFVPLRLRLVPREERFELDEGWILRIVSLNALSRFDLRPSWRVRVGATTLRDAGCAACLAPELEAGSGWTLADLGGFADLYAGADAVVDWAPHLSGLAGRQTRFGVGPGGVLRLRVAASVVLVADGRWRWLPDATPRETFDLRAALRLHVAKGLSLSLEARRTPAADEGTLSLQAFY